MAHPTAIPTIQPGGHPLSMPDAIAPAPSMVLTHASESDRAAGVLSWQAVEGFDPSEDQTITGQYHFSQSPTFADPASTRSNLGLGATGRPQFASVDTHYIRDQNGNTWSELAYVNASNRDVTIGGPANVNTITLATKPTGSVHIPGKLHLAADQSATFSGDVILSNVGTSNEGLIGQSVGGKKIFSVTRQESPSVGTTAITSFAGFGVAVGKTGINHPSSDFALYVDPVGDVTFGGQLALTSTGTASAPQILLQPQDGISGGPGHSIIFTQGHSNRWTFGQTSLAGPNGSAAAPAYGFSETGLGMYRVGGSTLGFAVSGVERFRVSSAGANFSGQLAWSGTNDQRLSDDTWQSYDGTAWQDGIRQDAGPLGVMHGFFGATEIYQPTHVTHVDESSPTAAANAVAINRILARVESLGLFATS